MININMILMMKQKIMNNRKSKLKNLIKMKSKQFNRTKNVIFN